MKHNTEAWITCNIKSCIDDDCTIPTAADRLGISKELAAEYYKNHMVENLTTAIHELYGNVRTFKFNKVYFYFHPVENIIIGKEEVDNADFKCPPIED